MNLFFQTILLNSEKLRKKIINNNIRFIDWISGPTYPRILTKEDLKKIIGSECIFARKIEQNEELDLIELLKVYIK